MAKNPESEDQAKTGGPASQKTEPSASESLVQRVDVAHESAPARPNFLTMERSANIQSVKAHQSTVNTTPTQSTSGSFASHFDSGPEYLPPKLRQRMQALMAELSAEVEPTPQIPENQFEEIVDNESCAGEESEAEPAADDIVDTLIVPKPGELVELPSLESDESVFDDIDPAELASLGIETHPIENTDTLDSPSLSTIPFREVAESSSVPEMVLETAKYLDPMTLVETYENADQERGQDRFENQSESETSEDALDASIQHQQELASTAETFSQQACEIVEILKRRQSELARYREQLEIGKAKTENELRQQRLELVEKKRELLDEVTRFRKSQVQLAAAVSVTPPQAKTPSIEISPTPSPLRVVRSKHDVMTNVPKMGRRITLESIAMPVANAAAMPNEMPTDERSSHERATGQVDAADSHLDYEFLNALERHLSGSSVSRAHVPASRPTEPRRSDAAAHSLSEARLKQQAASLKKQHTAAIGSLQKTRRQLELLRSVVVQQQQQTAERACDLDQEHENWNATRSHQQQELEVDRRELDRLTSIRENELSKRETAALQRENAVKQLESKLQQAQVEILRDRVILRQLERTARQTLSNTQWNERLAIITEETDGYLQSMKERAEAMKTEASQQIKRLDSRQSELLLYRESLRNWVQRQMKLISRRSAHLEEREELIQQRWNAIAEARVELQEQQDSLNAILRGGLEQIDDQLETPPTSRIQDAA